MRGGSRGPNPRNSVANVIQDRHFYQAVKLCTGALGLGAHWQTLASWLLEIEGTLWGAGLAIRRLTCISF